MIRDFKRQENEGKWHFIWRLYNSRKLTGVPNTEECGEICRNQLNETYDESAFRKAFEAWDKIWQEVHYEYDIEENLIQLISDLDEKENQLYKTRIKTLDVVREKRRLLRDEARIESLKEYILECFKATDNKIIEVYSDKFDTIDGKSAILPINDWHVGLECNNYWNICNADVIVERVNKLFAKVVEYCTTNKIKTIYVACLGDMISGSIHTTTRIMEEFDSIDQSRFVAKLIYQLLFRLADYGFIIKYNSVVGNHDRLNKNYKEHIEKESFNKIIDWYIEDKFEENANNTSSNLDMEFIYNYVDDGIGIIDIDGDKFISVHGHQDKVSDMVNSLSRGLKIDPRGILCGHWHHKSTLTDFTTKVFVNGTLSGLDEYCKGKRYWTVPSQSLIILDGKNTIDIDIILD